MREHNPHMSASAISTQIRKNLKPYYLAYEIKTWQIRRKNIAEKGD